MKPVAQVLNAPIMPVDDAMYLQLAATLVQQMLGKMTASKTGNPSEQYAHWLLLSYL